MRTITKSDLQYAEGIAYRTCPIKDFDHPLWKECLSAARFGLVDAARKYDPEHAKKNWKAFMAIRVRGEVLEILRKERVQANIGLTHRNRNNQDKIQVGQYDTIFDLATYSLSHESAGEDHEDNYEAIDEGFRANHHKSPKYIATEAKTPEGVLLSDEISGILFDAMNSHLPAQENYVLELFYFQEMTIQEIRKYSKLAEDEIQRLLDSGIGHLRELLKDQL